MKKLLYIFLLICPVASWASTQESPKTSVKKIISYSESGGDVLVQLARNGSQCDSGYWLKKTDPGFQANYLMLITAFQSKSDSIIIEGYSYQLWPGSHKGMYCHVSNVQYSS
ncbi:MAG: hypothetical protein JKY66_10725 [Spongiibacteraceae bacterium]|nr:hypothetical protein [Spongiibacteraceae bacterium]